MDDVDVVLDDIDHVLEVEVDVLEVVEVVEVVEVDREGFDGVEKEVHSCV